MVPKRQDSIQEKLRRSLTADTAASHHSTSFASPSANLNSLMFMADESLLLDDVSQSTTTDFSRRSPEEDDEPSYRIADRETKAVNCSRVAVILVLLVCGSVMGGISFWVGRRAEEEACYTQVNYLDDEMVECVERFKSTNRQHLSSSLVR